VAGLERGLELRLARSTDSADGQASTTFCLVSVAEDARFELARRCHQHAFQACGWLPVRAASFDVLVCAAYKRLMAPRGAAFCYLAPELRERMRLLQAAWYAGQDVHQSYYGPPLHLADSAWRFDTSPAWFSFAGAAPAIELLNEIGIEAVHAHVVRGGPG
jgi:selenocysteine lyase/cysteine desulfurase